MPHANRRLVPGAKAKHMHLEVSFMAVPKESCLKSVFLHGCGPEVCVLSC